MRWLSYRVRSDSSTLFAVFKGIFRPLIIESYDTRCVWSIIYDIASDKVIETKIRNRLLVCFTFNDECRQSLTACISNLHKFGCHVTGTNSCGTDDITPGTAAR